MTWQVAYHLLRKVTFLLQPGRATRDVLQFNECQKVLVEGHPNSTILISGGNEITGGEGNPLL